MQKLFFKKIWLVIAGFGILLSCKQTRDEQLTERNNKQVQGLGENRVDGQVSKTSSVKKLQPFPVVEHTSLNLTEMGSDTLLLLDFQAMTLQMTGTEEDPEYYHVKICTQQDGAEKCKVIQTYSDVIFYPAIAPGLYHIYGRACIRKELAVDEIECGNEIHEEFNFAYDNRKSKYFSKLTEWVELTDAISEMPHRIDQILKTYKSRLEQQGLTVPDDDSERVINNILTLGPYKYANFFFSEQFQSLHSSMTQEQSGTALNLTKEKDPNSYEFEDNVDLKEKSTMGKILIVGGLTSIFVGFVNLNNVVGNMKYDRQMDVVEYWKGQEKLGNVKAKKMLKLEEDKLFKLDNTTVHGKKRVSDSLKKAGGFLGAGILIFGAGIGMDLAEESGSVNSFRRDMMNELSKLEEQIVPKIERFHSLSEELGFPKKSAE